MTVYNRNPQLKNATINQRRGSDVASASTINLTLTAGNLVVVTGTTTITAITMPDGAERVVRFTGALTLTNGASLILPGSANITTAAGDFAVFRGYASGVVRCVSYNKISGHPVLPVGMNLLSTVVASLSSTIDLEITLDDTYDVYQVIADNVTVSTDNQDIGMRIKTGGSYDGATNYSYHADNSLSSASTYSGDGNTGDTSIQIAAGVGNAAGEGASFIVNLYNPSGTTTHKFFDWSGISLSTTGNVKRADGAGKHNSTAAYNGVRFFPFSGTFITGNFRLYGIKK